MIESHDALRSNVERVVTNTIQDPLVYTAVRMSYAVNGTAVTFMLGESWTWDGASSCPVGYNVTFAREFRYDSGRVRYLNRELDPAGLMQTPAVYTAISETWTDYDGDRPYRDFTVSGGQPVNGDEYVPGIWRSVNGVGEYLHSDHLGTLRRTTSATGVPGASRVFTAFGEHAVGPDDRFGYVGALGYQQHDDFPFLHVGARWYDPASGRFLQRDPIGIFGELGVYTYVENVPTAAIDPYGLISSLYHPEAPLIFAELTALGYSIGVHVINNAQRYNWALSRLGPALLAAIQRGQAYWDPVTQTIRWSLLSSQHVRIPGTPSLPRGGRAAAYLGA